MLAPGQAAHIHKRRTTHRRRYACQANAPEQHSQPKRRGKKGNAQARHARKANAPAYHMSARLLKCDASRTSDAVLTRRIRSPHL